MVFLTPIFIVKGVSNSEILLLWNHLRKVRADLRSEYVHQFVYV